ncbi:unnamed protein product [Orchesella dallaii]|uniref:27 kDa hemolymph protein n=1 Tax=Orchesella dallaii TaxID=48710 RepID=A0ABP1QMY9_9HEXA
MIQGGSHFRKVLTVLTVTYLLHVNAATDNQRVISEIDKVETMIKTLKTPPELIDAVLKQVETHCKKNRTIDQSYLNNASKCMEGHLNITKIADDMRAAVPEGKMDTVFRDMCIKWPKVKGCLSEFFTIIDECWNKGDKVSKFVDEVVRFYCGDDNNGERIAIFFAEGGIDCVEKHGDDVKRCIEEKQDFEVNEESLQDLNAENLNELVSKVPKKDDICESIQQAQECTSVGLRKCKDPTPENLMTSMLMQVGKGLECKIAESKKQISGVTATSAVGNHAAAAVTIKSVLLSAVIGILAF